MDHQKEINKLKNELDGKVYYVLSSYKLPWLIGKVNMAIKELGWVVEPSGFYSSKNRTEYFQIIVKK